MNSHFGNITIIKILRFLRIFNRQNMNKDQSKLLLKDQPTFKDFQEYVHQLELELGFIEQNVLQKCLMLGEEIGELFKQFVKKKR